MTRERRRASIENRLKDPPENFCCFFDDPSGDLNTVDLVGTTNGDEFIGFTHTVGATKYNLASTGTQTLNAVARGLQGDDKLWGSDVSSPAYSETLFGDQGEDIIRTQGGDDTVYAGADDDRVYGGDGVDWLFGQRGIDRLYGEAGDDWIHGGLDNDTLYGGSGNDAIYGGRDADVMYGQSGNDVLCDTNVRFGACPTPLNTFNASTGTDKVWQEHAIGPSWAVCNVQPSTCRPKFRPG